MFAPTINTVGVDEGENEFSEVHEMKDLKITKQKTS